MAVGMAAALAWHGWQGWGLQKTYPYNTFLFNPASSYTDYLNARNSALLPVPYASGLPDGYFPASYALFYRVFAIYNPMDGFLLFLNISLLTMLVVSIYVLHPIAREQIAALRTRAAQAGKRLPKMTFARIYAASLVYALAVLCLSYPVWFVINRANNEIFITLFIGLSLVFISQCRYGMGMAWLLPGICLKLYPAVLLVLFLRRKKLFWIGVAVAAFVLANWASLATFSPAINESLDLERKAMALMYDQGIIGNWGMAGSATAWNGCKLLIEWLNYQGDAGTLPTDAYRAGLIPLLRDYLVVFNMCSLLGAAIVSLYAGFIEREFLRRVVALLLFLVMASPYGADYKLLHVVTALMAMLLIRTRRPCDWVIVALLAFVLVPKKEILIPFAGTTDSGFADVSVAIILNPLCMLLAAVLLAWDGLRQWKWRWSKKRFLILLSSFGIRWGGRPPAKVPVDSTA